MATFVLEIGTEELPARFLPSVEKDLHERFSAAFAEAHLNPTLLNVFSTPRRSTVMVEGLESVQPEQVELVMGPPARIAFGPDGKPGKAALGFARTVGVEVEALETITTDKGDYLAAHKKTGGAPVTLLLETLCPQIISALAFAKRMRWGCGEFAYARPIRWILALIDENVVPFTLGGVTSDRKTWGHREHGPGPFTVCCAQKYQEALVQGGVTLAAAQRRAAIVQGGDALAKAMGGKVLWKESLIEEVQGLCEHPHPLMGDIDALYLELPRQVLLTSMETHQKSFGVEGADGKLLPHFLTVLNMTPPDTQLVKKGWERVLRARLEDARFFWNTDLESSFDQWRDTLQSVIFLAPLGSMGEKTQRISALCTWLATATGTVNPSEATRAGLLSKADLVSAMVGEFDTLQGIMGSIYAEKKGETPAVSAALAEQYLPAGPDSPVPATDLGALLSMADKADTLVGCFGLGMIPTGAADPYALRRAALGIARIMLEKGYRFDVARLFAEAQKHYGDRRWKLAPAEAKVKLEEFFTARLKNLFLTQGCETLLVEAATANHMTLVWATGQRLAALKNMSEGPDFPQVVQTFKRVTNIVRKQDATLTGLWNKALLHEQAEHNLAATLEEVFPRFDACIDRHEYTAGADLLAALRPVVDAYFEKVMVMCDQEALRTNRLNMLKALTQRIEAIADFSALQM